MLVKGLSTDGNHAPAGNPIQLFGNVLSAFAFCPSARGSHWTEGNQEYSRKLTSTFAKGYAERVTLETGTAANWRWRRIVFASKSDDIRENFTFVGGDSGLTYSDSTNGHVRACWNFSGSPNAENAIFRQMFQGDRGVDWSDIYNAKLNPRRIRIISDRIRNVNGGNGAAHWNGGRFYDNISKTLIYDQNESGNAKEGLSVLEHDPNFSWFSREDSPSGDIYVVDLFSCANGASSDTMLFVPHGTYYWHE